MTAKGPAFPRMADCRDCASPIRFVKLDTGNALPVDPLPNPERGNVAARLIGGRLVGFVISRDRAPGFTHPFRFLAHHATCPERPRPAVKDKATPLF